jgi:hypothetical protein
MDWCPMMLPAAPVPATALTTASPQSGRCKVPPRIAGAKTWTNLACARIDLALHLPLRYELKPASCDC